MTNEEAVKVLEDMKVKISIPKAAELQRKRNEAIDMAIEALSSSEIPNNSDTVSRKAAIVQLSHIKGLGDDEWEMAVAKCIQILWELPSVEQPNSSGFLNSSDMVSRQDAIGGE